MAGSSFDPLALVKAMGHQTDPYSWAQNFGKSVDAKQALLTELANKMDIAEMTRDAQIEAANIRAKAGGANAEYLIKKRGEESRRTYAANYEHKNQYSKMMTARDAAEQGFEIHHHDNLKDRYARGEPGFKWDDYTPIYYDAKPIYIKKRADKQYQRRVADAQSHPGAPDPLPHEAPIRGGTDELSGYEDLGDR